MLRKLWLRFRPAVLWEFPRGSWQYDVVVVLILAFIFLTPEELFNDRPSQPVVQEIEHAAEDARVFWVDPGALGRADPETADGHIRELLDSKWSGEVAIERIQPTTDLAGNVQAYLVFTRPVATDARPDAGAVVRE